MVSSWPGTKNWVASTTATSADMDTYVTDCMDWLAEDHPRCRLTHSSSQSIGNASWGTLSFNTETYDVRSMHSVIINTDRITIPSGTGGLYEVGGSASWANSSVGDRRLQILVNGSTSIAVVGQPSLDGGTLNTEMDIYTQYRLSAGDYLTFRGYQTSGGNLAIDKPTGAYSPVFYARWLAE